MNDVKERTTKQIDQFRADVVAGLSTTSKHISSKYFYDANGDAIFQRIMKAPEYYLTNAENEILRDQAEEILAAITGDAVAFEIIELGAGDGTKTMHLLRKALDMGKEPTYRPVDISQNILNELGEGLKFKLPALAFKGIQGESFGVFDGDTLRSDAQKCILFLGSNIGNLSNELAVDLLGRMANSLDSEDRLFVGFDLKKDPEVIRAAYNDANGATRDFNLNLLHRINTELGGNIAVDKFVHTPIYNPHSGQALSYLVATEDMNITLRGVDEVFSLRAWEAIHLEISQKYDLYEINTIAQKAGLSVVQTFTDKKKQYVNVALKKRLS